MTPLQNLYYALGLLAYSIAKVDGTVQKEEKNNFHKILSDEFNKHNLGFDYSEIIFKILDKDKMDTETSYRWAMEEMKQYDYFFTPDLKNKFIDILQKVAEVFPPVTEEEKKFIEQASKDINDLNGKETNL